MAGNLRNAIVAQVRQALQQREADGLDPVNPHPADSEEAALWDRLMASAMVGCITAGEQA